MADLSFLLDSPPEKAVKYFEGKGLAPSFRWTDLWAEEHAKAFTVAKAMRLDILQDIHAVVGKAISEGRTLDQFKKELTPLLQAKGWWGRKEVADPKTGEVVNAELGSPRRLETIFRQNVQSAYMAGRWREQAENSADRPFLQYVAVLDSRTRPGHAALDGKVFKIDDPFWDSFYPPNGWRCRCRVRALDDQDLKDRGLKVEDSKGDLVTEERPVSAKSDETRPVTVYRPKGTGGVAPDLGFDYNPGKDGAKTLDRVLIDKLQDAPAPLAKAAIEDVVDKGLTDFLDKPQGLFPVMYLPDDLKDAIKGTSNVVVMSADTAVKNLAHHPELGVDDYKLLPTMPDDPLHVVQGLLEGRERTIVIIKRADGLYLAAIKSTTDGNESFLTSYRKTSERDVRKILLKGRKIK